MVTLSSLIAKCINSIYNSKKKKENNNEEAETKVPLFMRNMKKESDSILDIEEAIRKRYE